MAKFTIADYEENGYHDSYFYAFTFDTETNEFDRVMTGATAFAGGISYNAPKPTAEEREHVHELVLAALAERWYQKLVKYDNRAVMEPDDVTAGMAVELLKDHTNIVKTTEPCRKCNGTGKWVNPNRSYDERECFTCRGRGQFKGEAQKDDKGKQVRRIIKADSTGTVMTCQAYGKFYANGYNKPGRGNRQVTMRLEDGSIVNVPLEKLRLPESARATESKLRESADRLAYDHNYRCIAHYAWLSYDFLAFEKPKCAIHYKNDRENCLPCKQHLYQHWFKREIEDKMNV